MGENQKLPLQLSFNRFLRVGFQGSRVSSNGGLILVRELDERLQRCLKNLASGVVETGRRGFREVRF